MTIQRFEFRDLSSGWTLEPMDFSALNLLIGLSGSGKTSILRALMHVVKAAVAGYAAPWHAEWALTVEVGAQRFTWSARTEPPEQASTGRGRAPGARFVMERLALESGEVVVQRDTERFLFRSKALPRLNPEESALRLLKAEEPVASVVSALARARFSWGAQVGVTLVSGFFVGVGSTGSSHPFPETIDYYSQKVRTIEDLRENVDLPLIVLSSLLSRHFPERFLAIVKVFQEIFPNVTEVKAARIGDMKEPRSWLGGSTLDFIDLGIKERGMDGWAVGDEISSGMRRTLLHLLELELLPAGSVVLVDEFEHSLGLNCLDSLTERLVNRAGEVQFVLTSHHPYVLNNIGREDWRIVTRRGAVVKVVRANEIPELNTRSAQSGFALLMNSETVLESVS